MRRPRLRWERWQDPYAPGHVVKGVRCRSTWPGEPKYHRCMRQHGHVGLHRFTSGADGSSVSWD